MIEAIGLTKRYGTTLALDEVSFTVEDGAICGLLGPNGAGKSTTMNIMTGCIAATEGKVLYDGLEIYEDRKVVKRQIGYLPEQPPLYPDMTPVEYLSFVAQAKGIPKRERPSALERVIEECGISEVGGRLIKYLSKGYRQRVGIAQALLGDPQVVILDEPTVGLDPLQIIEIRSLVKELGRDRTVIVSSHILSEIRALCTQIVIIANGRLVADDTPEGLERSFAGPPITTVQVKAPEADVLDALSTVTHIASIETVPTEERGTCTLRIEAEPGSDLRVRIFFSLAAANLPVVELSTQSATLEDAFVKLATSSQEEEEPEEEDEALRAAEAEATADADSADALRANSDSEADASSADGVPDADADGTSDADSAVDVGLAGDGDSAINAGSDDTPGADSAAETDGVKTDDAEGGSQ